MNPEWSLRNRNWVVANLRQRGYTQVQAEEVTDRALEELEDRALNQHWCFHNEGHFARVWLRRARRRGQDLCRRRPPQLRPREEPLAPNWLAIFETCLAGLTEDDHQVVLRLYYWEGMGDQKIGDLRWPQLAPKQRHRRARSIRIAAQTALRRVLLDEGMEAETLDFVYGPLGRIRPRRPERD